ncbi:MAG: peptidoglycan DD-metalloendopeptidase family protein [Pseudomonadota bacterium]
MSNRNAQKGGAASDFLIGVIAIAVLLAALYWDQTRRADDGSAGDDAPPVADGGDGPDEPVDTPDETGDDNDGGADEGADEGADGGDDAPAPSADLTDETGDVFSYVPVGELLPDSGPGFVDETVYRPDILFPVAERAYLNSQVYRYGGYYGSLNGMDGGQCNPENYAYPWQDTFCEKRSRDQDLCPGGGHEGLDIRPATCTKEAHTAVAVEDARVVDLRRHWVTLQTADGTLYNYLHLDMDNLSVALGDDVSKGDAIGVISNDFYKSDGSSVATTIHLHFEMYENYVAGEDEEPLFTKVNPYLTLVSAYDRKLRGE